MSFDRLYLIKKPRYVTAEVRHFENGPVITASSMEWALKKQLYRYRDLLLDLDRSLLLLLFFFSASFINQLISYII